MILMLGVAGSGKSTQSQLLASTKKYRWISVGALLRRTIGGDDAAAMQQGQMLDDAKVIDYLKAEIARFADGPELIIDGFPRSVYQADWLVAQHANKEYALSAVVHLQINRGIVLERLAHRARPDDTKEAIEARFKEYDEAIEPIINELASHGVPVITIDASNDALDIFGQIINKLEAEKNHVHQS